MFGKAELAFRIKGDFDRQVLRRINQREQREQQSDSVGVAIVHMSDARDFALERVFLDGLDSDLDPLTSLNASQLVFIEMRNHPWIVSD